MLRQFLYLDCDLTGQFLSQLEGGLYEAETHSRRSTSGSRLEGKLSAGVAGGGGGRQSAEEEAVSRTLRQTPESDFQRFVTFLEQTDDLRLIDALDDSEWRALQRGQIVEVDASMHLPTIAHLLDAATGLAPLLNALPAFGGEVSDADAEGIAAMMSFAQTTVTVPVVASPVGSPGFRFVADLKRDALQVDAHELDGEATIVAKVRRKLATDEKYMVFEFFAGQNSLPKKLRDDLQASFADAEGEEFGDDLFITSPAAIVTPIAVYR
jgi:hypothetical protein